MNHVFTNRPLAPIPRGIPFTYFWYRVKEYGLTSGRNVGPFS
jgi:hypothetical protein